MDKTEQFLEELTDLTKKYHIEICGCGCCGSPWLEDIKTNEIISDCLSFDGDKYYVLEV